MRVSSSQLNTCTALSITILGSPGSKTTYRCSLLGRPSPNHHRHERESGSYIRPRGTCLEEFLSVTTLGVLRIESYFWRVDHLEIQNRADSMFKYLVSSSSSPHHSTLISFSGFNLTDCKRLLRLLSGWLELLPLGDSRLVNVYRLRAGYMRVGLEFKARKDSSRC